MARLVWTLPVLIGLLAIVALLIFPRSATTPNTDLDDPYPYVVEIRFYPTLEPVDRAEKYEVPLHEALEAAGVGEVIGGGTLIGAYSDVAAAISDLGPALVVLKRTLRDLGAPATR